VVGDDDEVPQGREGESRDGPAAGGVAKTEYMVSTKEGGEGVGCLLVREWDEGGIRRGAHRLLTMTGQTTDGVALCQAGLAPW
jgi:hypothetical protein